jgi:hypothetical protein
MTRPLSRRQFAGWAVFGIAGRALNPGPAFGQSGALPAGQVVERIKEHLGVPWRGGPTDTFKSGDENSQVTGIATTVMSTLDVIQRAAAAVPVEWIPAGDPFWRP